MPAGALYGVTGGPPSAAPYRLTAMTPDEIRDWRDFLHSAPARAVADDLLAALDQLEAGHEPAPYLLPLPAYSAAELARVGL